MQQIKTAQIESFRLEEKAGGLQFIKVRCEIGLGCSGLIRSGKTSRGGDCTDCLSNLFQLWEKNSAYDHCSSTHQTLLLPSPIFSKSSICTKLVLLQANQVLQIRLTGQVLQSQSAWWPHNKFTAVYACLFYIGRPKMHTVFQTWSNKCWIMEVNSFSQSMGYASISNSF